MDVCRDVALEPVEENPVSVRHAFAHDFATWLEKNDLSPSRECRVERSETKRYYRIGWTLGLGEIGGEVRIYSEQWIQITWDGDNDWMPMKGSKIFDMDMFAHQFMLAAFIDRNWSAAQMIPEKQTKRNRETA